MKRPLLIAAVCTAAGLMGTALRAYEDNPLVIRLDIPGPEDSGGGIIVADVNHDARMDFLVTVPGHLAVYDNGGRKLWIERTDIGVGGQSESQGLPGHHGPGVAAGDVDADRRCEVLFMTKDGLLHVVDGASGKGKRVIKHETARGARRWEIAMLADFRGSGGDRDVLLQATNQSGYRTGKFLLAFAYEDGTKPLWTTDRFVSCAHNGARLADLDGDGRDEVLGRTILSPDGKLLTKAVDSRSHIDSVFVADVRPELPGLEVVMLEEGANHVQLVGCTGPIWREHFHRQEPQNAAVGRFQTQSDEIFIWCRSRYPQHQKPFVFNSAGKVVFNYRMDDVAPPGWTASGVEVIHTIHWTGRREQLACAKERHTEGHVCLFEPLTGKFVKRFEHQADRLYVADVTGDWREEIIVLEGNTLYVHQNPDPNPRPNQPRLWAHRNYRRLKQCHNYYSP